MDDRYVARRRIETDSSRNLNDKGDRKIYLKYIVYFVKMGYRRKKDEGKENGRRFQRRATMYPFNTFKFL